MNRPGSVPGISPFRILVALPSPSIYGMEYIRLAVTCASVTCHELCHMTLTAIRVSSSYAVEEIRG